MKCLVLIKIGGGLITDKSTPFTVREDMMHIAAEAVHRAIAKNPQISFIVANGAGSFGHYLASQSVQENTLLANQKRISGIHESVARLNNIFTQHLLEKGVPAFSMSPSSFISAQNGAVIGVSDDSLQSLLTNSFVPVLHGDIVADGLDKGMIMSTENLFEILIERMQKLFDSIQVVYAGESPGVLDKSGSIIPKISAETWKGLSGVIKAPTGYDVTGGMLHKVESALRVAKAAKSVHIVSGKDIETITAALDGAAVGTKIGD